MGIFFKKGPTLVVGDITDPNFVFTDKFQLVMSIEVIEHIPRELHPRVFDFLASHSTCWIGVSVAQPGQGGVGHVAERSTSEIIGEFEARGFTLDREKITKIVGNAAVFYYLRKNFLIFKKRDCKE